MARVVWLKNRNQNRILELQKSIEEAQLSLPANSVSISPSKAGEIPAARNGDRTPWSSRWAFWRPCLGPNPVEALALILLFIPIIHPKFPPTAEHESQNPHWHFE